MRRQRRARTGWRRFRMKYYFAFSLVLFVALILANLFLYHRYFGSAEPSVSSRINP